MAADAIDIRLARLEGVYEQVDKRLAAIEADVRDLRAALDANVRELRTALDEHFRLLITQVNRQIYWFAGILIASLGSLAVSLVLLLIRR